jgi:hypothetical protein
MISRRTFGASILAGAAAAFVPKTLHGLAIAPKIPVGSAAFNAEVNSWLDQNSYARKVLFLDTKIPKKATLRYTMCRLGGRTIQEERAVTYVLEGLEGSARRSRFTRNVMLSPPFGGDDWRVQRIAPLPYWDIVKVVAKPDIDQPQVETRLVAEYGDEHILQSFPHMGRRFEQLKNQPSITPIQIAQDIKCYEELAVNSLLMQKNYYPDTVLLERRLERLNSDWIRRTFHLAFRMIEIPFKTRVTNIIAHNDLKPYFEMGGCINSEGDFWLARVHFTDDSRLKGEAHLLGRADEIGVIAIREGITMGIFDGKTSDRNEFAAVYNSGFAILNPLLHTQVKLA